jgi:enterochelin esterase-like enzyme
MDFTKISLFAGVVVLYLGFAGVMGVLLPRLRERVDAEGGTYLLGASLGALASARYAMADPGRVAGLAFQSGAFLGAPSDPDLHESARSWFREALDRDPGTLPWR